MERLRFELSLRSYPAKTNFVAKEPWSVNPSDSPLKEIVPITQEQLEKQGFQQNVHYSSVVRIDPQKDCRGGLPDHLTLPQFNDKFIARDSPQLARCLTQGAKGISLNDLKWQVGLRSSSNERHTKKSSRSNNLIINDDYMDYNDAEVAKVV